MLCTKRAGWGVLDKDSNPASATHNDIASCNSTSHVVFFVLYCDNSAPYTPPTLHKGVRFRLLFGLRPSTWYNDTQAILYHRQSQYLCEISESVDGIYR